MNIETMDIKTMVTYLVRGSEPQDLAHLRSTLHRVALVARLAASPRGSFLEGR